MPLGSEDAQSTIAEIARLKAQAIARVSKHRSEVEKAEAEVAEYETALKVLARVSPAAKDALSKPEYEFSQASTAAYHKGSIASVILDVMNANDKIWWTANELQVEASRARGAKVPMTSISPNLSKLKNNSDIVREDLKVALASRVRSQKSETSEDNLFGKPSEASADSRADHPSPAAQDREAVSGGGT